jgi:hypothetical protein
MWFTGLMRLRRRVPGHALLQRTACASCVCGYCGTQYQPLRGACRRYIGKDRFLAQTRHKRRPTHFQSVAPLRSPVTVGGCLSCCVGHCEAAKNVWAFLRQKDPSQRSRDPIKLSGLQGGHRTVVAPAAGLLALQPHAGSRSNACLDAKAEHLPRPQKTIAAATRLRVRPASASRPRENHERPLLRHKRPSHNQSFPEAESGRGTWVRA